MEIGFCVSDGSEKPAGTLLGVTRTCNEQRDPPTGGEHPAKGKVKKCRILETVVIAVY